MNKNIFYVEDEFGQTKEATSITTVSIENRRYVIYSIPSDNNISRICASKLIKDDNGVDRIENIEEGNDKSIIKNFIDALSKKQYE